VSSETLHEPFEKLTPFTIDLHRALQSIKEELDAIDWYQQRADITPDPELKAILEHNRDEEKEPAVMVLEWIRRHDPAFAEAMSTYLFTEGDLTAIEERKEHGEAGGESPSGEGRAGAIAEVLTVGSLKGT